MIFLNRLVKFLLLLSLIFVLQPSNTFAMDACVGRPASINWSWDASATACTGVVGSIPACNAAVNFTQNVAGGGSKSITIPANTPSGIFCTASITCQPDNVVKTDTLTYDATKVWDAAANGGLGACVNLSCPAGQYPNGTVCSTCPANSYCLGGTNPPTACPNTWTSPVGSTNSGQCVAPPLSCPAGQYPNGTVCSQCPANSYCPGGTNPPTACTAGWTSPAGSTNAGQCVPPAPTATTFTTPSPVTIGTPFTMTYSGNNTPTRFEYRIDGGPYSLLPINTWTGTPESLLFAYGQSYAVGVIACNASGCSLPDTKTIVVNPLTCPAGQYPNGNVCSQCPANSYCPGGTSQPIACPPGWTSPAGSTNVNQCIPPVPAMTSFSVNPGSGTVDDNFTWTYAANNTPTKYQYYFTGAGGNIGSAGSPVDTFNLSGTYTGTVLSLTGSNNLGAYTMFMRGCNAGGCGAVWSQVTFTLVAPLTPTASLTGPATVVTGTDFTLALSGTNATMCRIYRFPYASTDIVHQAGNAESPKILTAGPVGTERYRGLCYQNSTGDIYATPPGSVSAPADITVSVVALTCPAGQYNNSGACSACPAGSYCNGTNPPVICTVNTYCPGGNTPPGGSNPPVACPPGWTSPAGSTNVNQCIPPVPAMTSFNIAPSSGIVTDNTVWTYTTDIAANNFQWYATGAVNIGTALAPAPINASPVSGTFPTITGSNTLGAYTVWMRACNASGVCGAYRSASYTLNPVQAPPACLSTQYWNGLSCEACGSGGCNSCAVTPSGPPNTTGCACNVVGTVGPPSCNPLPPPLSNVGADNLFLSSGSLIRGQFIRVTGRTLNWSNNTTGVAFTNYISYKWSTDAMWTTSANYLKAALAGNSFAPDDLSNPIPLGQSGTLNVKFCTDIFATTNDSDLSNNCFAVDYVVTNPPQIPEMTLFTIAPDPVTTAANLTWTYTADTLASYYQWYATGPVNVGSQAAPQPTFNQGPMIGTSFSFMNSNAPGTYSVYMRACNASNVCGSYTTARTYTLITPCPPPTRWDTVGSVCADPQVVSAAVIGDFTPAATINFTCSDSNAYSIIREPAGANVTISSGVYAGPRVIPLVPAIPGNYAVDCKHGSLSSRRIVLYTSVGPPPATTIILDVYPKTLTGSSTVKISWNLLWPVPACTLRAEAVCTNGACTPSQTAAAAALNRTFTPDQGVGVNHPGTIIHNSIRNADPITHRAIGNTSVKMTNSGDLILDCGGGIKATQRVRVTTSGER